MMQRSLERLSWRSCLLLGVMVTALVGRADVLEATNDREGRWKIDGTDCYWEPNDDGGDQCDPNSPTGRSDFDGSGTCVYHEDQWGEGNCSGNITVTVVNANTNLPIGSAAVTFNHDFGFGTARTTDSNGNVVFGAAAGSLSYSVGSAGYYEGSGSLTVNGDGSVTKSLSPVPLPSPDTSSLSPNVLGISGNGFTLNGVPRFLVFVSYFDAMRRVLALTRFGGRFSYAT